MTTYQRPKMLDRAIKSVLNQTFKDWELIIVDDASKDKTEKICDKYARKDSRIRYIKRSVNFGTHTQPKNQGIQAARADLVAFLDDDNTYRRDHLQVLWVYLKNNDIVYGDRWLVDKTGKGRNMIGIRSEFNSMALSKMNYIDTSDVLVRKKCLEAVGGWDEDLPVFADWNLWIRLAKKGYKFQRVPIIITDYYIHEGMNQIRHRLDRDPMTGAILPTYFKPDACKIWPDKTILGHRSKLKVAIFTLTMNRKDYTQRMYKSMNKRAGYDFDWFVVDNGSTDGTIDYLGGFIGIDNICVNKENVGISKASNQALEMIGDDYDIIIKVDNDCLFLTDNWLAEIVDIFERQQKLVVSPRVEGLRDNPGGVPRSRYFYVGNHFLGLASHLGGICVAAPKGAYEDFRWEDRDFLHGEQDYVFSQYALKKKHLLCYMENVIVEHMDTTVGQEKQYPDYFKEQTKRKQTKHVPKEEP